MTRIKLFVDPVNKICIKCQNIKVICFVHDAATFGDFYLYILFYRTTKI